MTCTPRCEKHTSYSVSKVDAGTDQDNHILLLHSSMIYCGQTIR